MKTKQEKDAVRLLNCVMDRLFMERHWISLSQGDAISFAENDNTESGYVI
ncbi:hypothetical protein [Paenibacillus tundrae]